MSELSITLLRVVCDEITDDVLEGTTDEVGWSVSAKDGSGKQLLDHIELPMPELAAVAPRSEHKINRELIRLGPEFRSAVLQFWDHDTFSANDLLGTIDLRRDEAGHIYISPGKSARKLADGSYHLTGEGGDYRVWLKFEEIG